jgi:hypothetical protein
MSSVSSEFVDCSPADRSGSVNILVREEPAEEEDDEEEDDEEDDQDDTDSDGYSE